MRSLGIEKFEFRSNNLELHLRGANWGCSCSACEVENIFVIEKLGMKRNPPGPLFLRGGKSVRVLQPTRLYRGGRIGVDFSKINMGLNEGYCHED